MNMDHLSGDAGDAGEDCPETRQAGIEEGQRSPRCESGYRSDFLLTADQLSSMDANIKLDTSKLITTIPANSTPVVLVSLGSFSPVTYMHLRLMEDARDHLNQDKEHFVIGGFLSPTHAKYNKKTNVAMHHRINMCRLGVQDSPWLCVDPWECAQDTWTRTAHVLRNRFTTALRDVAVNVGLNAPATGLIKVIMICGGDLLKSFSMICDNGEPLWAFEDQKIILRDHGVICIQRKGTDIAPVLDEWDILRQNKANVIIVEPAVENSISSTRIRTLLAEGRSVKYLLPDPVISYLERYRLIQTPAWGTSSPNILDIRRQPLDFTVRPFT
eukprot:m.158796 g.158796  ORF g.158796 m.158796 type:complete len:328 (-) comp17982_c1_seq1:281-1264(-)